MSRGATAGPVPILVALVAGAALGALARLPTLAWLASAITAVEPAGIIFIRLISMVVVPLVVSSLFVAVASLEGVGRLGRIGGVALSYFVVTTAAAAVIGLIVAVPSGVGVGAVGSFQTSFLTATVVPAAAASAFASAPSAIGIGDTLLSFVPDNPIAAAARGDLLPLLVAVCIFAAAAVVIDSSQRKMLIDFFRAIDRLSTVVLGWIMRVAAPAVAILIASAVARSGTALIGSLAWFALVVVAALVLHTAIVLIPALVVVARQRVLPFVRTSAEALILGFSTASSSAALPVSLMAADRMGLPAEASSLVLPLGATIDKNGAAVYKAVAAVFVVHLTGGAMTGPLAARIVVMATMAAFTGAGVPGSSLVTTMMVLRGIGLDSHAADAIALLAGIDRPLDMCRTAVNTFGNLVGTAVVSRWAAAD